MCGAFIRGLTPMMEASVRGDKGVRQVAGQIECFTAALRGRGPHTAFNVDSSASTTTATITLDSSAREVPVPPGVNTEYPRVAGLMAPFAGLNYSPSDPHGVVAVGPGRDAPESRD